VRYNATKMLMLAAICVIFALVGASGHALVAVVGAVAFLALAAVFALLAAR
jgi:hypothetical protein